MAKEKLTKEEELQIKLKQKLYKFNPSETESYLLALLEKCLEATAEKDYLTLGNVEDLLNKSLIILGSKIENFNLFYSNLRLKAAIKFLAKYIEANESEAFNFLTVLPEFVTVEEAKLMKDVKDFQEWEYSKGHLNYTEELFQNEEYTVFYNGDMITVLKNGTDVNINFESWEGDISLLGKFVTSEAADNPKNEVISIHNSIKASFRMEKIEKMYGYIMEFFLNDTYFNFEEHNILYFKENTDFIVVVTDQSLLVIFEKNTGKYNTFANITWNLKNYLYSFLDYCLGVPTEEAIVPETTVQDVYNIFTKVLTNGYWHLKGLVELYEEEPSRKLYKLLNSYYLRVNKNLRLLKTLLEEKDFSENVRPETVKEAYNSFNDFNSISSKVLDIAKEYNKEMTKESEEIHRRYLEQQEQIKYLESLNNRLNNINF